jgi:hypothetical protein
MHGEPVEWSGIGGVGEPHLHGSTLWLDPDRHAHEVASVATMWVASVRWLRRSCCCSLC